MAKFLIVYVIVGAILFGIFQFFSLLGRNFSSEPVSWEEPATLFVWTFLLWPIGFFAIIFALIANKPLNPK